ncbi:hypothetical protein GCM10010421_44550 [Streptomyces glaucus]|uniref:Secreted protein n=1 Tax=Streptomyces glaucus TaxID=284029 RepID=A0ABN3K3G1_9ACTN
MSSAGAACTDSDSPVAAADPVICRTSRFCTVSCIHVPAFDTKFAKDHQRMLRCRRDRQGEREAAAGGGGAGSGAGAGRAGEGEEDTVRHSKTSRETPTEKGEGRGAERRLRCAAAPRSRETARTMVAEGTAESRPARPSRPLAPEARARPSAAFGAPSVLDHSFRRGGAGVRRA